MSLAGYVGIAVISYVFGLPYLRESVPFADIYVTQTALALVFFGLQWMLVAVHLISLTRAGALDLSERDIRWMSVLFGAICVVTLPVCSKDLFAYLEGGRIAVLYRQNPYVVSYQGINDAFTSYAWHRLPMPYGPASLILSAPAAVISHWSVGAAVVFMKAANFGIYLGNVALVAALLKRWKRPVARPLFLFALHPLVLTELMASGHNDGLAILFMLVTLFAISCRMPVLAAVAALAAPMVKIPFAVVPAVLGIFYLRRRDFRAFAILLGCTAAVAVALHFTFFPNRESFNSLFNPRGFGDLRGIQHFLGPMVQNLCDAVSAEAAVQHVVFPFCTLILAGVFFWISQRAGTEDGFVEACGVVLLSFLAYAVQYWPWYIIWCLPLAALTVRRRLEGLILLAAAASLFVYLPVEWVTNRALRDILNFGIPQGVPVIAAVVVLLRRRGRPLDGTQRRRSNQRWALGTVLAIALALVGYVSVVAFQNTPVSSFERQTVACARALAAGQWDVASGLGFFTAPAYPMLLAIGTFFRVSGLVNPIVLTISLFLIYLLAATYVGRRIALLATLLLALNPYLISFGGSHGWEPMALLAATLGFYICRRYEMKPHAGVAVLAGIAATAGLWVNVLTGFCFLWVSAIEFNRVSSGRNRFKDAIPFMLGSAVALVVLHAVRHLTPGPVPPSQLLFGFLEWSWALQRARSLPMMTLEFWTHFVSMTGVGLLGMAAVGLSQRGKTPARWTYVGFLAALIVAGHLFSTGRWQPFGTNEGFAAIGGLGVLMALGLARLERRLTPVMFIALFVGIVVLQLSRLENDLRLYGTRLVLMRGSPVNDSLGRSEAVTVFQGEKDTIAPLSPFHRREVDEGPLAAGTRVFTWPLLTDQEASRLFPVHFFDSYETLFPNNTKTRLRATGGDCDAIKVMDGYYSRFQGTLGPMTILVLKARIHSDAYAKTVEVISGNGERAMAHSGGNWWQHTVSIRFVSHTDKIDDVVIIDRRGTLDSPGPLKLTLTMGGETFTCSDISVCR